MHPTICHIGPFTVYSYGLMLALAFLVCMTLASAAAKKQGIHPDSMVNLTFLVFIAGILGARLFYVVENWSFYLAEPREIVLVQHGGLSWFGGLFAGIITGGIFLKKNKMPVYPTLDLLVPYVALGQAIGRIGCLLNGCCFGRPSQSGIYFPAQEATLVPAQLYSSLALLFIFICLKAAQERPHGTGGIFYLYLLLYSIKRFFIEFLRADNSIVFFGLTLFQLICIPVFIWSVAGLAAVTFKRRSS